LTEGIGDYTVLRNIIKNAEKSGISSLIVYSGDFDVRDFNSETTKIVTFPRRKIPLMNTLISNWEFSRIASRLGEDEIPKVAMINWKLIPGFLRATRRNQPLRRCKLIVEDRSPPVGNSISARLQWAFYSRSWRKASIKADLANVLVPSLEEFIRDRFEPPDKLPFIHTPSGVDIENFHPNHSYQAHSGTVKLVYHGALNEGRGLERIQELILQLRSHSVDAIVTIIGDGELSGSFRRLSEENEYVNFLGRLSSEQLPIAIASHDYGILPLPDALEWNVGSPLKIMEFAASGLVCLTTDVRGTEPFSGQRWISRADRHDPVGTWVSRIVQDSRDVPSFDEMREEARSFAISNLTWEESTKELMQYILVNQ
jgi:glycosyltransferase involved in cell wall biosynthesis